VHAGRGVAEFGQPGPCALDRFRVTVDAEQPPVGTAAREQLVGMPRPTQRAVDEDRPRLGLEKLYYLL